MPKLIQLITRKIQNKIPVTEFNHQWLSYSLSHIFKISIVLRLTADCILISKLLLWALVSFNCFSVGLKKPTQTPKHLRRALSIWHQMRIFFTGYMAPFLFSISNYCSNSFPFIVPDGTTQTMETPLECTKTKLPL